MSSQMNPRFMWTTYYTEFADKLSAYRKNRTELLALLEAVYVELGVKYPFDYYGDKLNDIDPFTIFGAFNKGIKNSNRVLIMNAIGKRIGVDAPAPSSFDGIPVVNNMKAWFICANVDRGLDDADHLWELFSAALELADNPNEITIQNFITYFDGVVKLPLIKWNITMALYWIRPFFFINLDGKNRETLLSENLPYAQDVKKITDLKVLPTAKTYLALINLFHDKFKSNDYPVTSFPELSQAAWDTSITSKKSDNSQNVGNNNPAILTSDGLRSSSDIRYWIYSPGEVARKWDEFYAQGVMGIGWDDLGDLRQYPDREAMRSKLKALYDNTKKYQNDSLATWQFTNTINKGDIIFAKRGLHEIIGRGVVESAYIFDSARNEYKNIRKVRWTHSGSWQHPGQAVMKTLTDITQYTEYVQKLEVLVGAGDAEELLQDVEVEYDTYSSFDFLSEVFMDSAQYESITGLLNKKKNIILQGAPGVGKTFAAKRLAYSRIGEKDVSRVSMIQFHQSYSYEDFIMGFRPSKDGFELKEGPFYSFCKLAQDDLEREYFFIIDEINRGNLSKIFGELLMLIESDKRGEQLRLLYSNELFSVPANVYIIGLMNTADRSLALIDYALRRRFAFYEMEPAFDSYGFQMMCGDFGSEKLNNLVEQIKELNASIQGDDSLGDGFRIGHSYLCMKEAATDTWLRDVVAYEILPLLREYWFDEKSKVEEWTKKLLGVIDD